MQRLKPNEHPYLHEVVENLPKEVESISDYLYLANVSVAVQETLYSKLKQIGRDEYTWLDENLVQQCRQRLENVIGKPCDPCIEETIIRQSEDRDHTEIDAALAPFFEPNTKFRFTARVDLLTTETLWELKCTSKLSIDHMLQTIIYAWLWRTRYPEDVRMIKLFNIRTGEIYRLETNREELTTIMVKLLKGKYQEVRKKTNQEFVADCLAESWVHKKNSGL
jgi:hypothetical protein